MLIKNDFQAVKPLSDLLSRKNTCNFLASLYVKCYHYAIE